MTVHEWYVDPSAAWCGDGSKDFPFKTLALADSSIEYVNNDIHRFHLKARSILRERVPSHMTQTQIGLYMDVYDGSEPATFDVTADCTDAWTLDADRDWYSARLGTQDWGDREGKLTIGAVFEDGLVMRMRMYDADHSNLRASMRDGEYAYDWDTGMVYMVPSDRTCRHRYRVAIASQILALGAPGPFWNQDKTENRFMWNRTFEGIVFKGAKRSSVEVMGGGKVSIRECGFYGIGGQQFDVNSACLGNAIEIAGHATVVEVKNCWFDQIFDTAVTPQVYTPGHQISDFVIEGNVISNNGLSGIEVSTQYGAGADSSTSNVVVRYNHIKGNRDCFAPEIYHGRYLGIAVIYNAGNTRLENIVIQHNLIEDQIYNGMTVTGGQDLCISDNEIRRCNLGIFYGIARDQTYGLDFRQNRIIDCSTGIRTNSGIECGQARFRDNVVQGGEKAYSDGSPSCAPVELVSNVLNGRLAIESARTDGITGSGNSSTGTVDPAFAHLF